MFGPQFTRPSTVQSELCALCQKNEIDVTIVPEQSLLLFCIKQNKGINYPLVNPAGGGLAAAAAGCPATTAEGAICCFKAEI